MNAGHAYNTYRNSEVYEEMNPQELILLLYNEALKRLNMARAGALEDDPKKRGENLSRAIAIIGELSSSVDSSVDTEEINFLRGLYKSILFELPKVNLDNNVKVIDTTCRYITELKKIWELNVMGKTPKKVQNVSADNQLTGNPKSALSV